jgi:hypothetical protein
MTRIQDEVHSPEPILGDEIVAEKAAWQADPKPIDKVAAATLEITGRI